MWFWYGLAAAAVGAIAVIYQQKALRNVRSLVLLWSISVFPIPMFLLFIPKEIPSVDYLFFVGTLGSASMWMIAKLINFIVLKQSALSHIFPLSSFSTLFTYILGVMFLGENLTGVAVLGILLSIVGVYLLQVHKHKDSKLRIFEPIQILVKDKASLLFILSMFLIAISSVLDKLGILHTFPINPPFALLIESIALTIASTVVLHFRDKTWMSTVKANFRMLFLNGLIYGVMGLMVFWGFASGPIALVSAVKKTQILFVMILSFYIFKDRPPNTIWLGAGLMILGVVFTKL